MVAPLSSVALLVKKIANGSKSKVESQQPKNGVIPFSWANFFPKVFTK